jgi:Cd2+/Zn2+-exporting ATPase/Cu+-exporting ATPase
VTAQPPAAAIPGHREHHDVAMTDLARVGLVALGAAAVWFRVWEPLPHLSLIGLITTLVGGYPIFAEALANIRERKMTMELSMTIALVAALAIGEFFTALVILLFVLVAEILEEMTVERGRRAIRDLLDLLPRTVSVRRDGLAQEVPASEVRPGEAVLVAPGARIPVDGLVVGGRSFVDQSPITGESMPVEKVPGTAVYAGTINQSGALEIRSDRLGRDTSFGKIIEAVERAERSRAPIQKTADRLAGYLVYFAIGCAALTFLITRDVRSTISVVIVAGACGIAAGTPLAILGAIGRAAREGAIVKGGRYLEVLARVDTVVLDKTGTLTFGRPAVQRVVPAPGLAAVQVVETAGIAERRSEHPLGRAIVERAGELGLTVADPEDFDYTPGRGIVAQHGGEEIVVGNAAHLAQKGVAAEHQDGSGASAVLVARGGRFLGTILVADMLRPEAAQAVRALKGMGIRTVLLTGDARAIGAAVGRDLGIDELESELLPEEKVRRVRALVAGGCMVAMVGDGINDAPALVEAHVGVAMGSGTDVARESADVVLLGNDLLKFVETLRLARRMRRIILQNFAGTLAVDGLGVALAAFGLISPLLAAFIHVSSELAFILNSTRLLPRPVPSR